LLLGVIFISIFYLAWGLTVTHFCFVSLVSTLTRKSAFKNGERTPGCVCGLIMRLNVCTGMMETPLIGGFVEKQHEIISSAWSGKMTEGLASLSDCPKAAKIMPYEDAL